MFVSVVVRSFNRINALLELLTAVLVQEYDRFEVVVVEQSTDVSTEEAERLAHLQRDSRVRLLRFPPLGGPRARNVGTEAAKGEIVLYIDDDDVPLGTNWISAHVANYADPHCLGVTGRHIRAHGEQNAYGWFEPLAYARCQSFSWLLKLPFTYVRIERRKTDVHYVHGTNGSIRRSAFERFGPWDEDTKIEDEASFGYRAQRAKLPSEYFVFDPAPMVLRRMHLAGGLEKRLLSCGDYFERFLDFIHAVVRRYHPWRVAFLYPLYVLAAYSFTLSWLWDDSLHYQSHGRRSWAAVRLAIALPWHVARCIRRSLTFPPQRVTARRGGAMPS
jgi:glycosyltransferase involved in cell wall biosynthesis